MKQHTSQPITIVVLISGNGSNLQTIIDHCQQGDINGQVVAVISNQGNAYGLIRAQNAQIDALTLEHTDFDSRQHYDRALQQAIDAYQPDLVVLAGFMRILTADFVQHYQGRLLNIHPSLLPKYPGLNTHQRALDAGDQEHGVSVHFVTEQVDGGPVILQAKVPILPDDNASNLALKVQQQEHRIYPLVIQWFCQSRLNLVGDYAMLDNYQLPPAGYSNV